MIRQLFAHLKTSEILAKKDNAMARKPNYRFERSERDRQKAAKKAARLLAKQEKSDARKETEAVEPPSEPPSESSEG